MKQETELSPSGLLYAKAYQSQYGIEDLHAALLAYNSVVVEYPDTKEAGYAKSQIQNIARSVVPEKLLYKAQFNLALEHSELNTAPDKQSVEVTPPIQKKSDR